MRILAKKYEISDRGLAKACEKADVPVPERGYWNKLQAGKNVSIRPLPTRGLGKSNNVAIGIERWNHPTDQEILKTPLPPAPEFETPMDDIRVQVMALASKVSFPKSLIKPHRLITKMLKEDEIRLQKKLATNSSFSWNDPVFDTPFEQRRLKILNALFTGMDSCGIKPSYSGKQARELNVMVGDQYIPFMLDSVAAGKKLDRERQGYCFEPRNKTDGMRLSITSWHSPKDNCKSWEDSKDCKLEDYLSYILAEIMIMGEESYRSREIYHYERLVERKAEVQEKERNRILESKRKALEQKRKLEQQRIDHLLNQAELLHQAKQIRSYVAAVQEGNATSPDPMPTDELKSWSGWALAQANRIDPIISGGYRKRV